jgi:sterol 3beta-glucosyltransferase
MYNPKLVVPFFAEQPFWGSRIYQLGCGPVTIPFTGVNAANLEDGIDRVVNDSDVLEKAQLMGQSL